MENIDFVLLDNVRHPLFEKYSDIYINSKTTTEPIIYYKIKVLQIDEILNEFNRHLNRMGKREIKSQSIKSQSIKLYNGTQNISFRDDLVIFMNNIDILDILLNLGIIIDEDIDYLIRQNLISKLDKKIKHECEKIIQSTVIFPINLNNLNDIEELELSIVLAIKNNKIIGYLLYKINDDDNSIYIEFIEVNEKYRNLSLCKKLITYLIKTLPDINTYELYNVGGLSGYSCYVDSFESNNFIVELQKEDIEFNNEPNNSITNTNTKTKKTLNNLRLTRKTKKLNLTKMENIKVNKEFNCSMKFTRK